MRARLCCLILTLTVAAGCRATPLGPTKNSQAASRAVEKVLVPSNDRNWRPDQAVLSRAEFNGDQVTVRNIRNCTYLSAEEYVVDHYDKQYRLVDLKTVDFIVVPFQTSPSLAHTMLSFGFTGDEYLAVSVEVRKEVGETYSPLRGALRQYEIMYVVGDERDLIGLRSIHRGDEVYVYRSTATPERVRELFVDVMQRVNKLAVAPEFYDTVTNNCTTNIVQHVNRLRPGRIPLDFRVWLPGRSDSLAYELGLIESQISFEETRRRARIHALAKKFQYSPDFSVKIRR